MADTTENVNDGSIESAISSIIEPEVVENEETIDETESTEEESTDETEVEDSETEVTDEQSDDTEYEESDGQDTEEVETSKEPVYTVKIDGTEKQVTLSELKRGYSGQEYVQKGMQEAAQQRKQAEDVYAALLNERQQVAALYQQIQSGQFVSPPQPPSRELFDSDPIGYMEAKLNYDEQLNHWNAQNGQMQQLMAQQSQAQQAARQAYMQQELQSLRNVVPELADPVSASKIRDSLLETGQAYGYSAEEISQAVDHRAIHVLRDAMKYREIMAGKQAADKKAAKSRKVPVKAGSKRIESKTKQVDAQKTKLKQTGRIEDAISLMFQ